MPIQDDLKIFRDIYDEEKPANQISKVAREQGATVTSTTGGRHNRGSKHYTGDAADIRTRDQAPEQVEALKQTFAGQGYRVLDERQRPVGQKVWGGPHLHVEQDDLAPFRAIDQEERQQSQPEAWHKSVQRPGQMRPGSYGPDIPAEMLPKPVPVPIRGPIGPRIDAMPRQQTDIRRPFTKQINALQQSPPDTLQQGMVARDRILPETPELQAKRKAAEVYAQRSIPGQIYEEAKRVPGRLASTFGQSAQRAETIAQGLAHGDVTPLTATGAQLAGGLVTGVQDVAGNVANYLQEPGTTPNPAGREAIQQQLGRFSYANAEAVKNKARAAYEAAARKYLTDPNALSFDEMQALRAGQEEEARTRQTMAGNVTRALGDTLPVVAAGGAGLPSALGTQAVMGDIERPVDTAVNMAGVAVPMGLTAAARPGLNALTKGMRAVPRAITRAAGEMGIGAAGNVGQSAITEPLLTGKSLTPEKALESGAVGAAFGLNDAAQHALGERAAAQQARNTATPEEIAAYRAAVDSRPPQPVSRETVMPSALSEKQPTISNKIPQSADPLANALDAFDPPVASKAGKARKVTSEPIEGLPITDTPTFAPRRPVEPPSERLAQPGDLETAGRRGYAPIELDAQGRAITAAPKPEQPSALERGRMAREQQRQAMATSIPEALQTINERKAIAERQGDLPTLLSEHDAEIKLLKEWQKVAATPEDVASVTRALARSQSGRGRVNAKLKRQQKAADAPTAGLVEPRQPVQRGRQSASEPLLGAQENVEGGVPARPGAPPVNFERLAARQADRGATTEESQGNQSLESFLVRNGGVKRSSNNRGDVAYNVGREGGRPGVVNDRSGIPVDVMRQQANEAGFGPYETEAEFLDAIRDARNVFSDARRNTDRLAAEEEAYYANKSEPLPSEPLPARGRVVNVNGQDFELTPEQESRWRREVEEPLTLAQQRANEYRQRGQREEAERTLKGAGMRVAAVKRDIVGAFTEKEQQARTAREQSNYQGKLVSVEINGKKFSGKVRGNAFGKISVILEDGRRVTVQPDQIGEPLTVRPESAPIPRDSEPLPSAPLAKESRSSHFSDDEVDRLMAMADEQSAPKRGNVLSFNGIRPPAPSSPRRPLRLAGPADKSAAFPREQRALDARGRQIQEMRATGTEGKGPYGQVARQVFKSMVPSTMKGQTSFYESPNVKSALGLDADASMGDVHQAFKKEFARMMKVPGGEVSLTDVPQNIKDAWVRRNRPLLGEEDMRRYRQTIAKAQRVDITKEQNARIQRADTEGSEQGSSGGRADEGKASARGLQQGGARAAVPSGADIGKRRDAAVRDTGTTPVVKADRGGVSKTRLDLILDKAEETGEVTVHLQDDMTSAQLDRVTDAAHKRGMTAAFDGHNILVRKDVTASEPRAVTHKDPAINNQPILAETKDGRVIVPNEANKSGVSVVKDQGATAKEPWEMTQAEWNRAFEQGKPSVSGEHRQTAAGSIGKSVKGAERSFTDRQERMRWLKMGLDDTDSDTGLPWKQSPKEGTQIPARHHDVIKEAIRQGRFVPPEVLADYPDLAPKTTPAKSQPAQFKPGDRVTVTDFRGKNPQERIVVSHKAGDEQVYTRRPDAPEGQSSASRRADVTLVEGAKPTRTGFHVGDVLVKNEDYAALPESDRAKIDKLREDYAKLGVVRPSTEVGPNQAARMSDRQRKQMGDKLLDSFAIQDQVREILKPEGQKAQEVSDAQRKALTARQGQLERQISDLKSMYAKRLASNRDNPVKHTLAIAEKELGEVQAKLGRAVEASKPATLNKRNREAGAVVNPFARKRTREDVEKSPEFQRWFRGSKVTDEQGKPLVVYHGTANDFDQFASGSPGSRTGNDISRLGFFFSSDAKEAGHFASISDVYDKQSTRLAATNKRLKDGIYRKIFSIEENGPFNERGKLTESARNLVNAHMAELARIDQLERVGAATQKQKTPNVMAVYLSLKNPAHLSLSNLYKWDDQSITPKQPFAQLRRELQQLGHDGAIIQAEGDEVETFNAPEFEIPQYVAFKPTQIKSATGNRGTFDPSNPDVRYSGVSPHAFRQLDDAIAKLVGQTQQKVPVPGTFTMQKFAQEVKAALVDRDLTPKQQAEATAIVNKVAAAHAANDGAELVRQQREMANLLTKHTWLADPFRGLMAAGEWSFIGLQGAQQIISNLGNPKALKSMGRDMLKSTTRLGFDNLIAEMRNHPRNEEALKVGLALGSQRDLKAMRSGFEREEAFHSRLGDSVPGLPMTNRQMSGLLESQRLRAYDGLASMLNAQGHVYDDKSLAAPERAKINKKFEFAAEMANTLTGRGDFGKFLSNNPAIGSVLGFGPRWVASRFQLMNPNFYRRAYKADPKLAYQAGKEALKLYAAWGAVLTAGAAAGMDVSLDPDDSDFLKLKKGNYRLDASAGLRPQFRILAQMVKRMADLKDKPSDEVLKKTFGNLTHYGRTKLSPLASGVLDVGLGKNMIGEKVTPASAIEDRVFPIFWKGVYDAYKEEGAGKAARQLPNAIGLQGSEYERKAARPSSRPAGRRLPAAIPRATPVPMRGVRPKG